MGNSASADLAASSQAWEVNSLQCDCCDLHRTAVSEGEGLKSQPKEQSAIFQQTDKDLFILFSFLPECDALSDESQIMHRFPQKGAKFQRGLRGKGETRKRGESKTWNPRQAPAFISGVPVI